MCLKTDCNVSQNIIDKQQKRNKIFCLVVQKFSKIKIKNLFFNELTKMNC